MIGLKESVASKTAHNNVYSQLLGYRLLGNSFGISSGSFLFTNLVLANATNHTQTRCESCSKNNLNGRFIKNKNLKSVKKG